MIGDPSLVVPSLPSGFIFPAAVPTSAPAAIDALPEAQWGEFFGAFSASKRGALALEQKHRRGLLIGSAAGLVVGGVLALFLSR